MRVDQFVPGFAAHDAIGNHVLQVRSLLRSAGMESDIYGEFIDPRVRGEARPFRECPPGADAGRVILYQASTHSSMVPWLVAAAEAGQVVASNYHNITPAAYFARWEPQVAAGMEQARADVGLLAPYVELAVAVSAFNQADLVAAGYRSATVSPLLVDLADYHREPEPRTLAHLRRLQDRGITRWLFVGRIAPNKCQHDVIAAFALYRRLYDADARLTLIGGPTSLRYLRALRRMTVELELDDSVEFLDGVAFRSLLAYFAVADVFVCQSEHEGFCVPIIEAMELGVPVVAHGATAIPETVAGAGVVLDDKDPLVVARAVHEVLDDPDRRRSLIAAGRDRAAAFALRITSARFLDTITTWLDERAA